MCIHVVPQNSDNNLNKTTSDVRHNTPSHNMVLPLQTSTRWFVYTYSANPWKLCVCYDSTGLNH